MIPEIVPSLLAADFAHLADDIARVEDAGVGMLHLDIMDGHFVPNLTMGPPVVEAVRKCTSLKLDLHLMIEDPDKFAPIFIEAGAACVSIHSEATRHLNRTLHLIQEKGAQAGVVLNPGTPLVMIENVLDFVDYVLVMSVNPGFGGQTFIPNSLDKVRALDRIRREQRFRFRIEIDGGVSRTNVPEIVRAGCDWMVVGSSIFHSEDPAAAVKELQHLAAEAFVLQV